MKFIRRGAALLLALVLATASISAGASYALGDDLTQKETTVNRDTKLSSNVFWSSSMSDLRTENLITYVPNGSVTPIVTYGDVITQRSTVSSMARQLESQGYRVVAGINGDFYNVGNGVPIGLVMTDGIIRTGGAGYHAIGFRADGSAVLGKPALSYSVDLGLNANGESVIRKVTEVNKARVSTGGIYLYDYGFNDRHNTGSTEPGVDVLCTVTGGELTVGGSLSLRVDQVLEGSTPTAMGPDQYVLSCNSKSDVFFLNALRSLTVGQTVTVSVTGAPGWEDVEYAVGALYSLVENGSIVSGLQAGAAPRTAIGQKADGSLVFYTIDGRRSGYSIGASLSQVAERLVELGCVTALCLDGGGSTTLSVTQPDETTAALANRPSESSERAVSNQVFLVATAQPSGVLDHLYVAPENSYVLAGSSVKLDASGVDTNFIPMSASSFSLSASAGTVKDKVLTTPVAGGDITVTASQGGKSGSAVVHAIANPDSISISGTGGKLTELSVAPGDSVQLTGNAIYNHLTLASDAGAFTWSVTGDIGTIDAAGKFTAAAKPGVSGTITAKSGTKTATINVKVSTLSLQTVADFEAAFDSYTGLGATLSRNTAADQVRYGRASGKLAYDLKEGYGNASVALSLSAIGAKYNLLNLWVYGDNSGNVLTLTAGDGSVETIVDAATLDFSGWKQVSVQLPAGTNAVTAVGVRGVGSEVMLEDGSIDYQYAKPTGEVYVDQFVTSYGGVVDNTAPAIQVAAATGGGYSATVSDAVDGVLAKERIRVTMDGAAWDFTYDAAKGSLTIVPPAADGKAHRLTVLARDGSGNIGRSSLDIAAGAGYVPVFTDTVGYWAATQVDFLYTQGITTGYADGTFRPDKNINRQEFAVMLFRYLKLDGTKYESVELPFADNGKIADFAKTAIKALYTAGIINGTQGTDGKLYFNPQGSLTRAQAAAMIGRTQEKGYATVALSFTDGAKIPAYAAYYIQTMAAQGVIGGYQDGSFRPNANITRGQMAKILYSLQ